MKICNFFLLTPYNWPESSQLPAVHKSKWRLKMYRATLCLQWIYVGMMTVNFMFTLKTVETSSKMLGLVFLVCFFVTLSMRTVILAKEKQALDMICSFIRFEQRNPEGL